MPYDTAPFNKPFFRLHENVFYVLNERLGKADALGIMSDIFAKVLKEAYDGMRFQKGVPIDFARVVEERDRTVGLDVRLPEITAERIIYQFHMDPFPNLKGAALPEEVDATYIKFKVHYLLGVNWTYCTTKHLWRGDPYTEHVISKIA